MDTPRSKLPDHAKPGRHHFLLEDSSGEVASGRRPPLEDGTEEGEITDVGVMCEEPMERARPCRRGGRKRKPKAMDHSGLEEDASAAASVHFNDEPLLCLPMRWGFSAKSPHEKVAYELTRCLQEQKHRLVASAVHVMGVKRSLQLFHKTTEIQLGGGELTADGQRKKTPGGVFLTLVRKATSDEERKCIFQVDKKVQVWKKKEKQRQRIMTMEARICRQQELEAEQEFLQQTRQEKNTEKRFPIVTASPIPPLVDDDTDNDSDTDEPAGLEATKDSLMQQYWKKSITVLPNSPPHVVGDTTRKTSMVDPRKETNKLSSSLSKDCVHRNGSVYHPRADIGSNEAMEVCFAETEHRPGPKLNHEEILAQQFDLTDEADLDFGIDFG